MQTLPVMSVYDYPAYIYLSNCDLAKEAMHQFLRGGIHEDSLWMTLSAILRSSEFDSIDNGRVIEAFIG